MDLRRKPQATLGRRNAAADDERSVGQWGRAEFNDVILKFFEAVFGPQATAIIQKRMTENNGQITKDSIHQAITRVLTIGDSPRAQTNNLLELVQNGLKREKRENQEKYNVIQIIKANKEKSSYSPEDRETLSTWVIVNTLQSTKDADPDWGKDFGLESAPGGSPPITHKMKRTLTSAEMRTYKTKLNDAILSALKQQEDVLSQLLIDSITEYGTTNPVSLGLPSGSLASGSGDSQTELLNAVYASLIGQRIPSRFRTKQEQQAFFIKKFKEINFPETENLQREIEAIKRRVTDLESGIQGVSKKLDSDVAGVRRELGGDIQGVRERLGREVAGVHERLDSEIGEVRELTIKELTDVDDKFEQFKAQMEDALRKGNTSPEYIESIKTELLETLKPEIKEMVSKLPSLEGLEEIKEAALRQISDDAEQKIKELVEKAQSTVNSQKGSVQSRKIDKHLNEINRLCLDDIENITKDDYTDIDKQLKTNRSQYSHFNKTKEYLEREFAI